MNEIQRLVKRGKAIFKEQGPITVLGHAAEKSWVMLTYPYHKALEDKRQFTIGTSTLPYFVHPYNKTWKNERAVEIALGQNFLDNNMTPKSDLLEIGNVMNYYRELNHTVIDKYEDSPGILNQDLIDVDENKKYDLIMSISTFEHIGWDETPREPGKLAKAFQKLFALCKPQGKIFFTCPLGYNDELDGIVESQSLKFDRVYYLKRTNRHNDWVETELHDALLHKYDSRFPNANAIFVGYKD